MIKSLEKNYIMHITIVETNNINIYFYVMKIITNALN